MKIGILGGGQLAQMLALAGIPLGYRFVFYDPSPDCCAATLGKHVQAEYDNLQALQSFARSVDLITFEFENVPIKTIEMIAQIQNIYPKAASLAATQDRLIEKQFFTRLKIPTAAFTKITSQQDLKLAADAMGYPLVLKSRTGGYDGKGQIVVKSEQQLEQVWPEIKAQPFIAEQWVHFSREVSIIAARNLDGDCVFYDLVENNHHQGILQTSFNRPGDKLTQQARQYAESLMNELDHFGILTLEMFQVGDKLIANEYAPRVHNSGHWTIEGTPVSQFENHLRAILNLPLGTTSSLAHCAMVNFVGYLPSINQFISLAESHYHQYGKQPKPARKLGHLTICADTSADAELLAKTVLEKMK